MLDHILKYDSEGIKMQFQGCFCVLLNPLVLENSTFQ